MANSGNDRGAAPVVGNILLVAVAVIIAVTLVTLSFSFIDRTGAPTAEASFEYEQVPSGLQMTPVALGTDVIVKLNGEEITTIEADSAGEPVLMPTAPDDTITVVSEDEDRSVLINKEIDDRDEMGDFIAYYTFEEGGGSDVIDTSGNDNDGERNGNTTRTDGGLDFDGSSNAHVDIGDLTADGPDQVDEITVAITYEHDGGSDIQNLIEHQDSSFAWFMETDGKHGDPHQMEWNLGYNSSPSGDITTGDVPAGEKQVLVGTYDGNEMVFYRNGTRIDSETLSRQVALGEVILGADSDPSSIGQNLDGRIYEMRLYYAAFDDDEVQRITDAMS
jgi:FlaG/FlaF family flagellin (archaellin)